LGIELPPAPDDRMRRRVLIRRSELRNRPLNDRSLHCRERRMGLRLQPCTRQVRELTLRIPDRNTRRTRVASPRNLLILPGAITDALQARELLCARFLILDAR